jgi:hypothetical protein
VELFDQPERDVEAVRLETWGKVEWSAGVVPWVMVDPDGPPVVSSEKTNASSRFRSSGPG